MEHQLFTHKYPYVSYRVMKSDCTTMIGIIVHKNNSWRFIPKHSMSNYNYDNAFVSSNGRLQVKKQYEYGIIRDTFTRADGRIIIESEWRRLCEMHSPDYKSFKKNLNHIRGEE